MENPAHRRNEAPAPGPTVASILRRGHEEYRDLPAVVDPAGHVMTYGELGAAARRLVTGLQGLRAAKGDRVVVLTKNRSECFVLDHALAIGGYARVALSYRLHPREIVDIVRDAGARIVVLDRERNDVADALDAEGIDVVVVGLDEAARAGSVEFASLLTGTEAEPVEVTPDDVAWIPYTSGTSGRPKGVVHTHRSLASIVRNMLVELPEATTSDVVVHVAPLTHLSGYAMLAYFFRGARHIALGHFHIENYLNVVERHRGTVLPLVPTMINMLVPALEKGEHDVSSVHSIIYGGSPIAPDRLARAIGVFGPVFLQSYGLTEMPFTSYLPKQDHVFDPQGPLPDRLGSAGRVSPYAELRLMTAEGNLAGESEAGEIQLRGDARMAGYWNLPEDTAAVLLEGGWVATGDVGRISEGFLHVVDRKKDMIVSGGFNVYPVEVENAIYTLPEVAEVAVVGIPDDRWGESVHAVIVAREGRPVAEDDIRRACLASIAAYKQPRSIEFVDELPKTSTGKIMRRVVQDRFWAGRERKVNG
ncbi:class I adenylate-forming enzyme family protein [Streptomyces sp. NPDC048425]|uniref:class I adenylate-forming enzyme family protein n=1 Tax=Streptomyces sp. NPDC048425 TaxID=3365548 RepID=UPI0037244E58